MCTFCFKDAVNVLGDKANQLTVNTLSKSLFVLQTFKLILFSNKQTFKLI